MPDERWTMPSSMVLRSCVAVCAACSSLMIAAGPAAAKRSVSVRITAQVETVGGPEGLCVRTTPGDIMTATYTYTLGAPNSSDDPAFGAYLYVAPPNGVRVRLAGATTRTTPSFMGFAMFLENADPGGGTDRYGWNSYTNLPWSCGTGVEFIGWGIEDPTGTAMSSAALPKRAPNLRDFEPRSRLRVLGRDDASGFAYDLLARVVSLMEVD